MGGSKEESNGGRKSSSKKSVKFSSPAESGDGKETDERERKAELERKVRERVSLEARAFDVVNRLIEPRISQDYLLQACHFIDHSHYEDIVEERSISHLCGYPVCDNALPKMPKKKYHISTRSNTVYDITTRKKFCSNHCYNASEHLRKQIPETPVWTRRGHEDDTFHLLQSGEKCVEGEEVIGVKMLSLKEEVTLLESLDREEGGRRGGQSNRRSDLPLEDSQRLSDQLNALSTDHDLPGGETAFHSEAQEQGDSQKQTDHYMHTAETTLNVEGACQQANKTAQDSEQGDLQIGIQTAGKSQVYREDVSQHSSKTAQDRKQSDLEKQMGKLTVSSEADSEHDVLAQCERTEKLDNMRNDDDSKLTSREDKLLSDPAGLEKIKDLSIKDAGDVDSDDDSDDNAEDRDRETMHKNDCSGQTLDPVSSSTHAIRPGNVDSDDDEDDEDKHNKSVTKTRESDPVLKAPSSKGSSTYSDQPSSESAGNNPKDTVLRQQPGESKSAYLMRLLDHRKALLARVADVQSSETDNVCSLDHKTSNTTLMSNTQHSVAGQQPQEQSKPAICRDVSEKKPSDKTNDQSVGRRKEGGSQRGKQTDHQSANPPSQSPVNAVCHVISSWVTPDTLSYLNVHLASQQDSPGEDRDTLHRDPDMESKYQALCQRLAAKHSDWGKVVGEEEVEEGAGDSGKKPVPRFEELRKQTEQYQLQVQHFLQGPKRAKSAAKQEGGGEEEGERDRPVVLPVIDSHNQLLIRRRIVLERLDRTMPSLLPPLGLSVQDVSAPLRELVFTFSLTSHNIVFKPVEWTLVAIILLNMMGMKSGAVKAAFEASSTTSAFNLVLTRLGHSTSSLSLLVHDMFTQRSQALQSSS